MQEPKANKESIEQWNQPSESPKSTASVQIIAKWVTLLNVHFRADLTDAEQKIYIEGLRGYEPERLEVSFPRCLHECDFMPRIPDIIKRMPEEEFNGSASSDIGADFVPVKDWYESFTANSNLHIWMDQHGRKKVKIVPASADQKVMSWPQHWPEKDSQPMTWDEARKKLALIAKAKTIQPESKAKGPDAEIERRRQKQLNDFKKKYPDAPGAGK